MQLNAVTVIAEPVHDLSTSEVPAAVPPDRVLSTDNNNNTFQAQPASMSDMRRDDLLWLMLTSVCVLIAVFIIMFGFQLVSTLYIQQRWIFQVLDALDKLEKKSCVREITNKINKM